MSLTVAFIRNIFGYILSGIVLGLGFIYILFDKRHQGWHDKFVETVVVSTKNRPY